MNNGSTDIGDFLTVRGFGAYGGYGGGGYGGGGGGTGYQGQNVLAAHAHADGTALKTAVDGNADLIRAQTSEFENTTRASQFARASDTAANNVGRICDRLTAVELNALRQQADTLATINANAKDAAQCCCDLKERILLENGKTRDLIQDNALRAAENTNNINATVGAINSNANANTAAIVAAINANGNGHGGH